MTALLHPTYFPNIAHFVAIESATDLIFEAEDNFQKQTYRNRACIYGANGKLTLNIPVHHTQKKRKKYRDVTIANDYPWQSLHWKSIQTAYSTSPFFEFYADDLQPLFRQETKFLFDFNLECIETLVQCLELDFCYRKTKKYVDEAPDVNDFRYLVNAKKEPEFSFERYLQVFGDKHGFIGNLSILDLLFNEGPNTIKYLKSQSV